MVSTEKTPDSSKKEKEGLQEEICPHCGEPMYRCECPERWEDEGGAPYKPKDDAA